MIEHDNADQSTRPTADESGAGTAGRTNVSSRRNFFKQATTSLLVLPSVDALGDRDAPATPAQSSPLIGVPTARVRLTINTQARDLQVDTRTTLLDLLREQLDLTGTKKGCNHGQCGACTILVNGERINSCLALAVVHDGNVITTIEGLAQGDRLHPVQAAFIKHDGFQCGYCTSGQICSTVALLQELERGTVSAVTADVRQTGGGPLTDEEIRERMSGNICRCGAYPGIVAAVRESIGTV